MDKPLNHPPNDSLTLYGTTVSSRLLIGSALYPSPQVMLDSIQASQSAIVTVSLRRHSPSSQGGKQFWDYIKQTNTHVLPNTAGCFSADEAITLAKMSRDLFETSWIKLEVIGDDYNLQPDPFALLNAAEALVKDGFHVFPYCTDDLVLCERLQNVGCEVLMPWGAPIGTGKGLINAYALQTLRERLPKATLIVDAGLGKPSHATQAMELGMDAVLLNTAVAQAHDPVAMACAFALSVEAGRIGYTAGVMAPRQTASPSTPTLGTPFWHQS